MSPQRVFLIDGNSFCYRAFYAIRSLSNSKGQATNAVYGFTVMLTKLINDHSPDMLAVAFDVKGPTFRHKKYDEYKIHRKPMPDDLVSQIPLIKEVVRARNIPIYEMSGFEADDVLATVARAAERKGYETYIVTGDKDALQLVNDRIKVLSPMKDNLVYDAEKVREAFSVGPEGMTDLMALMGDSTDNVKGVPGIGEKTAIELMTQFGSLYNLYKALDDVKSESKRKTLLENKKLAYESKELVTLVEDVPIEADFDKMRCTEPDAERLAALYKELEFRKLLKEITPKEKLASSYELIEGKAAFEKFVVNLGAQKSFTFDAETTSEDAISARLVGISFSWKVGECHYVGVVDDEQPEAVDRDRKLDAAYVLSKLKAIFEDPKIEKTGQNIKYEYMVLDKYGIRLGGIAFDTMVASYVLNPSKLNHNLDDISFEYLNHKLGTPIEELIGKGKNAITMDRVPVEKVSDYCCEDSDVTHRLRLHLEKELSQKGADELFYKVEMPLVEVLARMELIGVSIDTDYLGELSKEMEKKLAKLTKKIYEIAGEEFNINSPKQLSVILFEKLKLPVIRRTKTGISTDEEVLTKLAPQHELPASLLKYREFSKLKSTYVDALPGLVNPKTGRLHTSFNQTVTQTGRLSSSGPNLQNIPVKTEEGRRIRKAFVPSGGDRTLMSADYSQIELRILAHLSGDATLMRAFKEGLDIHSYTASLVFGIDEKDVAPEMRSMAKTVNFGIIYGMSPFGLSQSLKIGIDKAKEFIDAYFERYPGVRVYLEGLIGEAREYGFVSTLFGRRRYIPEISSADMRVRQFAERTAINAPIQGTAADIIKIAMIAIEERIEKDGLASRMILQVHDELVFDVAKKELKDMRKLVAHGMEKVIELKVPVEVHIEAGKNWLEMEPV